MNRYMNALANAKRLSVYPFMKDYVDTIQPQIQPAIAELEAAYEAIASIIATSSATAASDIPSSLTNVLKEVEPGVDIPAIGYTGDDTPEINYQDYELFEYFVYQIGRASCRERV